MAARRVETTETITKKITRSVKVLDQKKSGWATEVNYVSWNDAPPVFDIRDWSPSHDRCGKGITLTHNQVEKLIDALEIVKELMYETDN